MADWDRRFLDLAAEIGSWSKDPSTKVGCVIVDELRRPLSFGYNGFPRGVADTKEAWTDHALKHKLVIHAEWNAILNATADLTGSTVYVTQHPCIRCAVVLQQAGVDRVVCPVPTAEKAERHGEDYLLVQSMFRERGITFVTV